MKIVETFKTRDGKIHQSAIHAENHILGSLQNEIKALLEESCPWLINNCYKMSQNIVMQILKNPDTARRIRVIALWVEDLQNEDD